MERFKVPVNGTYKLYTAGAGGLNDRRWLCFGATGGGKSGLRGAVCRVTPGICA